MNIIARIISGKTVEEYGGLINDKLPFIPDEFYCNGYEEIACIPLVNMYAYEVKYAKELL